MFRSLAVVGDFATARHATFRDEGQVWNEFMPSAATARLMQSIFDAAVA
jgi:hypothetical protein